ncbi:kielin/chordin-like protein [Glandiceps talaboti]
MKGSLVVSVVFTYLLQHSLCELNGQEDNLGVHERNGGFRHRRKRSACMEPLLETTVNDNGDFVSSTYITNNPPWEGRLHSFGAWCAESDDTEPWITVDLGKQTRVVGIGTQGRSNAEEWVMEYEMHYSDSGDWFIDYRNDGATEALRFTGNVDKTNEVRQMLPSEILTRYVRILPKRWNGNPCMRFELYGCDYAPIDHCESNECQNGAICKNQPFKLNYECQCAHGFAGQYCDQVVCGMPPAPTNGSFSCDVEGEGYVCNLECLPNLRLPAGTPDKYTCNFDSAEWSPKLPDAVQCQDFVEPTVGVHLPGIPSRVLPEVGGLADGFCISWGQNHYRTFDGLIYDFRGSCSYRLVADCLGDSFQIHVRNDEDCRQQPNCKRSLVVYIGSEEFRFDKGEDQVIMSKRQEEITIPASVDGLRVEKISRYIIVTTSFGFNLGWDGEEAIFIQVEDSLINKTCGLCGKYNRKAEDDLTDINGDVTYSVPSFAASYKMNDVGDQCVDDHQYSYCHINSDRVQVAADKCAEIKGDSFRSCQSVIDPVPFFDACMEDVCNNEGECRSYEAYARLCAHQGVTDLEWRTNERCRKYNQIS